MLRLVNSFLFFGFILLVSIAVTQAQMPGDVNEDSLVDVGDVVYEINYLFRHGVYPLCLDCADPNASCNIEIGDVVYLINYLFKDGLTPQIPECDWSDPVNMGPPFNSSGSDHSFRMSPNSNIAVWSSNRPGGYGNDDIWYSIRDMISGTWSTPHNCGRNINNVPDDRYPSISPDNKKLYCNLFGRPGTLGNYWDDWVSIWDSLNSEWGPIQNLGPTINIFGAGTPFISPDGSKLYFSNYGIWFSEYNGSSWGQPVQLINENSTEMEPTIAADYKTLYFTKWNNIYFICVSHWTGTNWGPSVSLGSTINDSIGAMAPYITPDGTTLYFTSYRAGGLGMSDTWVSQRIPAVNKTTSGMNLQSPKTNSK